MDFDDLAVIRGRLDDLREVLGDAKPSSFDGVLLEALRRKADEMHEYVLAEIRYRARRGDDS